MDGRKSFPAWPVAMYGVVLLLCAIAYYILYRVLIRHHGPNSALASAVGIDRKGQTSIILYAVAIPLSFINQWLALSLYVLVALMWFIPDRRIEKNINSRMPE
jgi:uncharacterized membrane protein